MEPFKNFISPQLIALTADQLEHHLPGFVRADFEPPLLAALPHLELKQRAQRIADHLHDILPSALPERHAILLAMLHPDDQGSAGKSSDGDGLCGWGIYPLTIVVGQHSHAEFDDALAVLREMTKRGTAEFDVRPYLIADQSRALAIITPWARDPNMHVRRLVSEGTRPRLPWGQQLSGLVKDPAPTLPLLAALRDDPEEYVRRSVANHLNDIAKDHPDLVADLAQDWMKTADKNRQKLLRHACRTLIKQGHPTALASFGIHPPVLSLDQFTVTSPQVQFGDALTFSATLRSTSDQDQALIIDYIVHFKKANGSLSGKVFKGSKQTLQAGQSIILKRSHSIRPITTRKYYPGAHALSLRINGQDFGLQHFDLVMP